MVRCTVPFCSIARRSPTQADAVFEGDSSELDAMKETMRVSTRERLLLAQARALFVPLEYRRVHLEYPVLPLET